MEPVSARLRYEHIAGWSGCIILLCGFHYGTEQSKRGFDNTKYQTIKLIRKIKKNFNRIKSIWHKVKTTQEQVYSVPARTWMALF